MLLNPQIQVNGAPTAPKAMVRNSDGLKEEEVKLHQVMNLLHSLGPFHGRGPVDRDDKKCSDNRYSTQEMRRAFLDGICYLCDINTMGGTVTAATLRKYYVNPTSDQLGPENIRSILYIAANETILPKVCSFVRWLLKFLGEITPNNRHLIAATILRKGIELGSQRMGSYQEKMRLHLNNYDDVYTWIRKIEREPDMYRLSGLCYEGRERQLEAVKGVAMENKDIAELAHYIGRLGAHKYAVSMIVTAWMKVPVLRRIIEPKFLPSAEARPIELPPAAGDFQKTCKVVCKNQHLSAHKGRMLNIHLADRNFTSNEALEGGLERLRNLTTRVHAELLIVDFFGRKKLEFADDDKYVGCSKPACYFCYKWITLHPAGFVPPATHNKVIPSCRGPDVDAGEDRKGGGAKVRSDLYARIVPKIIRDIEQQVNIEHVGNQARHQSSNGSTRAPSSIVTSML
ncbi:hypothetical protein AbraIFM66950_007543 [Aspergillus brasiliensis]|nr:hypothetical protein AbraIFM66950_007543 [Aspergillus brasiliensis]